MRTRRGPTSGLGAEGGRVRGNGGVRKGKQPIIQPGLGRGHGGEGRSARAWRSDRAEEGPTGAGLRGRAPLLSGPRRAGAEGRALERIQAGPGRAVMAARAGRGTGRGRGVAERSAAWLCVVSSPALHSPGRGRPASRPGDEDLPAFPARQAAAAAAAAGRLHCLTTARARLSAGKPASAGRSSPAAAEHPASP